VGVDYDLSSHTRIINKKVMPHGTNDFLFGPAMSEDEFEKALGVGIEMADECHREGSNILSIGEMGIGNTSPSSIWMHLLTGIPLYQCIGAGAGLSDAGIKHKSDVLHAAVKRYMETEGRGDRAATGPNWPVHGGSAMNGGAMIRYFGGLEMVAAMGAMLRAAELKMIILVDGFIMTACMAMAMRIAPTIRHYAIFAHQGDESGHSMWLKALGVTPILSLGLRLGEGTGALCAYPIVDSAVRMMHEMNTFEESEITKYF
jgi:nicotinate-nucleotide--dimethylbenzimidazole phosphoribosyltransferase